MKKLIVSAAIVLGSFSTFATPILNANEALQTVNMQEEYTEIKLEEVPTAVKEALKKAYPEAVLDKAYVNAKKEYKIDITVGDKKGSLFADELGNWIKK
jgi:hypothetical protein